MPEIHGVGHGFLCVNAQRRDMNGTEGSQTFLA